VVSDLSATVGGAGTITSIKSCAQEFVAAASSVTLADVVAALGNASGSFIASAELVADNGGLPGNTVVTTFTVPSLAATSPVDVMFTPGSSVILSANTDYWFVLSASGTGSYQWDFTDTLNSSLPNWRAPSLGRLANASAGTSAMISAMR